MNITSPMQVNFGDAKFEVCPIVHHHVVSVGHDKVPLWPCRTTSVSLTPDEADALAAMLTAAAALARVGQEHTHG